MLYELKNGDSPVALQLTASVTNDHSPCSAVYFYPTIIFIFIIINDPFLCLCSGERFVLKGLTAPTLTFAFLPSPQKVTKMTKRPLLVTHFKCMLSSPPVRTRPRYSWASTVKITSAVSVCSKSRGLQREHAAFHTSFIQVQPHIFTFILYYYIITVEKLQQNATAFIIPGQLCCVLWFSRQCYQSWTLGPGPESFKSTRQGHSGCGGPPSGSERL